MALVEDMAAATEAALAEDTKEDMEVFRAAIRAALAEVEDIMVEEVKAEVLVEAKVEVLVEAMVEAMAAAKVEASVADKVEVSVVDKVTAAAIIREVVTKSNGNLLSFYS